MTISRFVSTVSATLLIMIPVLCFVPKSGAVEKQDPTQPTKEQPTEEQQAVAVEEQWGIKIESLRISAGGYMIDFRFRVLDPQKAAALCRKEFKPYLIDQASGHKLLIPNTPKLGPLRQTAQELHHDRVYWMMFSNPGKFLKAGSSVTIVIGEFRAENLEIM
jgi:hypothetical protein